MSSNVLPFARRSDDARAPLAGRRDEAASDCDEMERAAQLWHDLRAAGRELRFELEPERRHAVATVHELGGGVVRALAPARVLGPDDDGPLSAA